MTAEERQKKIEEYLMKAEFASLEELARHVEASISTVRRDLTDLESGGNIRRTHGGARLLNPQSDEFAFSWRDTLQLPEKDAVGKACAALIKPGQSVIIDSGTSVYHAARHLGPHVNHVITNSLPVANLFASNSQIEVIVTGGVIYPRLGVMVGPLAVGAIAKLHADVAIMGGGGITLDGITNSHALLIDIQKGMIDAAEKVIFCLDHTKFGRRSVAQLCDLSFIDKVVTDTNAPVDLINELRQQGVEVIVAEAGEKTGLIAEPVSLPKPVKKIIIPRPSPIPADAPGESSDSRMGWD